MRLGWRYGMEAAGVLDTMYEPLTLRRDIVALGLTAVSVFLMAALLSYDPADPLPYVWPTLAQVYAPDRVYYPVHEEPQNACGLWGAFAAQVLFEALGMAAFGVVAVLAVMSYHLLRRRSITAPLWRLVGTLAILVGLSTLLTILVPGITAGPWIGGGGYLGYLTLTLLSKRFATTGSLILAASLVWCGMLLMADLFPVGTMWRWVVRSVVLLFAPIRWFWTLRWPVRTGERAAPAKSATLPVRVHGRQWVSGAEDLEAAQQTDPDLGVRPAKSASGTAGESHPPGESGEEVRDVHETGDSADTSSAHSDGPRIRRRGTPDREEVLSSLDRAAQEGTTKEYQLPSLDLLVPGGDIDYEAQAKEVRRNAKILEQTFLDFGYQVKVVEIETGPVIAQYEVQLEAGLRLSKITSLADDLAIALRVPSVRIVAPIPGKNTVGIEVPNSERQIVRLREVIEESAAKTAKMRVPLFLGKDVSGNPLVVDLSTLPHLLIAGRTGTGKSVCLNAIICSILMTRRPDEVRLLLIDPKMVELSCYGRLPHLMHPVVTDMRKAEAILAWAVEKMEERYALLARAGVRHISSYNQLSEEELIERLQPANDEERQRIPLQLPFIVIIADEMADLMMTAGKEVEQHIIRLAQKSRAVGIHLILATQKPTVDVITGLIKSNLPARISFQVASRTDSRVVLDEMGADKLLGNGDMLFLWPGTSMLLRGQGTFVSDDEIERIVDAVSTGEQHFVHELVNLKVEQPGEQALNRWKERDELYEQAIDIVVREQRGSVSLLQRALGIGYGRAARLIDFMEEDGIVGSYAGQHAREVLLTLDEWERMQAEVAAPPPPKPPPPPLPRPVHRIRPGEQGWDEESSSESSPENETGDEDSSYAEHTNVRRARVADSAPSPSGKQQESGKRVTKVSPSRNRVASSAGEERGGEHGVVASGKPLPTGTERHRSTRSQSASNAQFETDDVSESSSSRVRWQDDDDLELPRISPTPPRATPRRPHLPSSDDPDLAEANDDARKGKQDVVVANHKTAIRSTNDRDYDGQARSSAQPHRNRAAESRPVRTHPSLLSQQLDQADIEDHEGDDPAEGQRAESASGEKLSGRPRRRAAK